MPARSLIVSGPSNLRSGLTRNYSVQGQASNKPSANFRRYVYTYNMLAAQTPIQFYITCVTYLFGLGCLFSITLQGGTTRWQTDGWSIPVSVIHEGQWSRTVSGRINQSDHVRRPS